MKAIQEAKDMNVLSLDALIRSLTHEIELNEASEETNKRWQSIVLRSSASKAMKALEESEEEEEEEPSDDEDNDEKDGIGHLAERISKALIIRKKEKGFVPKKDKKGKAK